MTESHTTSESPWFARAATWGVVCVALVLRLAMAWRRPESWQIDIDAYLEISRNIADGLGLAKDQPPHPSAYRPPLYPVLLSVVQWLTGGPDWMGAVQSAWGAATVWLTLRCGTLLGLGRWRFVAGGLVAIDPLLLQYTSLPMTETLCAALVTLVCWLEWEQSQSRDSSPVWHTGLTGMAWGLLCLSRPTFLASAGLACVVRFTTQRQRGASWRNAGWNLLIWSLGCAFPLLPWAIRNAVVLGQPIIATTHGGYTVLLANNPVFYAEVVQQPRGTVWSGESLARWQASLEDQMRTAEPPVTGEIARDRWMQQQAWSFIADHPTDFLQACLWRAIRFWDIAPWGPPGSQPRTLVWGVALFYTAVSLGMLSALIAGFPFRNQDWWPLWVIPLTLFAAHLVYWTDMRMRSPIVPLLALLSACGWSRVWNGLKHSMNYRVRRADQ